MFKVILALCILFSATNVYAVELLVQAKPHWKDAWKTTDVNKLSADEKRSYNARVQIGDIVAIRPDNWSWGREEALPNYIVVKLPDISMETAKKYEENLMLQDGTLTNEDGSPKMYLAKVRKWQVPQTYVNQIINAGTSVVTINLSAEKVALINSIVEKTQ